MRNDFENMKSPFLDEEIRPAVEPGKDWQPPVARLVNESPFRRVFEHSHTTSTEPEELEDETEEFRDGLETANDSLVWELIEEVDYSDFEVNEDEPTGPIEDSELDPALVDLAEKTIAREVALIEHQAPSRWTSCFSASDIARVQTGVPRQRGSRRCQQRRSMQLYRHAQRRPRTTPTDKAQGEPCAHQEQSASSDGGSHHRDD